jgi:hypothetical protein
VRSDISFGCLLIGRHHQYAHNLDLIGKDESQLNQQQKYPDNDKTKY